MDATYVSVVTVDKHRLLTVVPLVEAIRPYVHAHKHMQTVVVLSPHALRHLLSWEEIEGDVGIAVMSNDCYLVVA